jgi:hypothetical protein
VTIFAPLLFFDLAVAAPDWRVITSKSGPTNYYSQVTENGATFLRSKYRPGTKTTVLGWQTPEADRHRIKKLRWTWRAQTLPTGGDECRAGKEDSAAVVYVTWKSGLRYHVLKYVWSAVGTKGAVCDRKRNPFVAQDTIIIESGPANGAWRAVEIDLDAEHRKHFDDAPPPAFVGLGIMSDGDQTNSESSADFGGFTLLR